LQISVIVVFILSTFSGARRKTYKMLAITYIRKDKTAFREAYKLEYKKVFLFKYLQ